jgi:hypothetical protein
MKSSRIARLSFSAAVALALPIGGAVALTSGPAGAVKTKTITCTKATGSTNTGKIKLKKCNGNTGTKSTNLSIALLASGGTVTWANAKTTTFGSPTLATGSNCPAGDTDELFSGTVSADTTGSAKPIPGVYNGEVCIDGSGNFSLPAGHPLTIN